jgi:hypothetical protein
MASLTGRIYVPAPNPVVPRPGLFNVATGPLDLPIPARRGGLQYQISTCQLPNGYAVGCAVDLQSKSFPGTVTTINGDPFVVYSTVSCSPIGLANWGEDAVRQFLYQQLVAGEQATVENIWSSSSFGINGIQGASGLVNLGSAQGPVQAASILESWLYARYGLPGVVHAPIAAAPYFWASQTVTNDNPDRLWRSDVGTLFSFGNYAGTGPTGQVPGGGSTWVYITGQVAVYRTPDSDLFMPTMGQVINRSTNVLNIVMEREYAISYDCYVAGVQVTLNTTDR